MVIIADFFRGVSKLKCSNPRTTINEPISTYLLMAFATVSIMAKMSADKRQRLRKEKEQKSNHNTESVSAQRPIRTSGNIRQNSISKIFAKVTQDALTNKNRVQNGEQPGEW